MEYLILALLIPPLLTLATAIALATGLIADPDEIRQAAKGWKQSWQSLS